MKRTAQAVWKGDGATGSGTLSTQSGAFTSQPYNFHGRFGAEDGKSGTNPEELIGAAHAGCFAMALSFGLAGAGFKPEELQVTSEVAMARNDGGWSVSGLHLILKAKVPGIADAKFQELAAGAKANCPISRLLSSVPITLHATLA